MLKEKIIKLINLKQEGGYWDFKQSWYAENKNFDLLHDIICLANNLMNEDGYIIIGVDEENDYSLVDVRKDENRRNTQNIVDFLKNKKFAGDIRPTAKVETIEFDDVMIDVIVIKNDNNTPYYLKETFRGVFQNNIYTRIQDTNTPKNSTADIDKVEWLWKKRFGLHLTPLEKFEMYILKKEDWSDGPYEEVEKKFHKNNPEYTIRIEEDFEIGKERYEHYSFAQTNSSTSWKTIKFKYHQTTLKNVQGVVLDGGRYFTPCPLTDSVKLDLTKNNKIYFKYMEKDSLLYILNNFFYDSYSDEETIARERFFEVVLLFKDKEERSKFKSYIIENWDNKDRYKKDIIIPYIPNIQGYKEGAFLEEYENALILKRMLKEFRK